jgi:hypothetical protein
MSARRASRTTRAIRRISACRTACSRLASRGPRRRARPARMAVRLLALDHEQAGGGDRAGKRQAVAAGSFDRHDQARSRGVIDDPGQQLGVAGAVVADLAGGDRHPGRVRDLGFMSIAVGVDADHGVDEFCQHGHRPDPLLGERSDQQSAPAWVRVTEWHIGDGSRPWADRLLIRPTGGPGRCRHPDGHVKRRARRSGPNAMRVTAGHRHRACWSSTQEHRNDTHRSRGGAARGQGR